MANPLQYGGSQPNAATNPEAGVNASSPAMVRNRNKFRTPYQYLNTERFADITPFLVQEVGFNEDFDYIRNTDLRAPTFASPMMSQITKHAHYIAVPKSVLYPRLWELMTMIPKKGDDLNFVNTRIGIESSLLKSWYESYISTLGITTSQTFFSANNVRIARALVFIYSVASSNSIATLLGCPVAFSRIRVDGEDRPVIVELLRRLASKFTTLSIDFDMSNGSRRSFDIIVSGEPVAHGIDDMVDWYLVHDIDDVSNLSFVGSEFVSGTTQVDWESEIFYGLFGNVILHSSTLTDIPTDFINLESLVAYQMSCANFFTSDDVDNVYTSHLYYQNMEGLISEIFSSSYYEKCFFTYNGLSLQYEPFSAAVLNAVCSNTNSISADFFIELFASRKSLRYGDMFNGARLRPLAVGEYSAPVVSNEVSAVDITKATLSQRLLNNVNSVRNTVTSFIRMLYGVTPDDVPMLPLYVAHSSDVLAGNIVANTTDNAGEQGDLVTNMSLHSQHREFSLHFNQDAILLGLTTYDCLQCYVEPVSPHTLKVERLDYFNPMLQNIGDQPVNNSILIGAYHLAAGSIKGLPFGYLQNDFEYKQAINQAHGAFADGFIPSWAYLRDLAKELGRGDDGGPLVVPPVVDSSFIRQSNIEFNQFFRSLAGVGSAYYHFIVSYVNDLEATRPMEYVSGVLYVDARN